MKIKAIPTMYAGVQFRSRLEARWAAYWDLREVEATADGSAPPYAWEYEPFDLDGWIPDFHIRSHWGGLTLDLIEVKPTLTRTAFGAALTKAHGALYRSGFEPGPSPYMIKELTENPAKRDGKVDPLFAAPWRESSVDDAFDESTITDDAYHREAHRAFFSGKPFYQHVLVHVVSAPLPARRHRRLDVVSGHLDAWKEAGNIVQWKSPRRRKP